MTMAIAWRWKSFSEPGTRDPDLRGNRENDRGAGHDAKHYLEQATAEKWRLRTGWR